MNILKLLLSLFLLIVPFVVGIVIWVKFGPVFGFVAMVLYAIYIRFFADKILDYINKEDK